MTSSPARPREFFLPELPRLLPVAYHPRAAEIEFRSNGWVRRTLGACFPSEAELLAFLRQRNGIYGPMTVPHADLERALDVADWYQYVTVIDSVASDRAALGSDDARASAVFAGLLASFGGPPAPGACPAAAPDPGTAAAAYADGARQLWRRITPGLAPRQVERLTDALRSFLGGCVDEIQAKLAGAVPDYETCMRVRLESFGCAFIELMTEYAAGVDMSDLRPRLAGLHSHAMRQMILVNDLLSWRKEQAQDDRMTAVRVLTDGEGLDLQSAVHRLRDLVEHHERAYLAARAELLSGPLGERADVRSYVSGVDHLIGGSQEFEYLTPRYFGDGAVWDGSRHGWIDLDAPVTRFRDAPAPPVFTSADAAGALPLLGHAASLWRRPLDFVASLPAQGDLVRVLIGNRPAFVVCHPDLVTAVLVDSRTYDKGGPLFENARLLVGNGLVSSARDDHRRQRRMVQPAFAPGRLPGYVAVMGEELRAALDGWRDGEPVDVSAAMQALTLRITARTLFGATASARTVDEVAECMPIIMRGVYLRMVSAGLRGRLPTPGNRRFDEVRGRMREVIRATIEDGRADGDDHGALLSILLQDDGDGPGLDDDEVYDQVMTLLIGGTETTGNTLTWALRVLSEEPDVERRLHAEIDRVLDGRAPTFDDLAELDYTWRVLTETLRLYPPAWLLTRVTTRRTELAGRVLPAGSTVAYSPYMTGRSPALFADPERFDPDRWLPERAAALPRGAMVPFGAGSRKCIGHRFGQAETTLTLAAIASRWTLRPAPGTARRRPPRPRASLGTGPWPMLPLARAAARVPAARA